MPSIEAEILALGRLDELASRDTAASRIDPRAKVTVTFVFLVCVVSLGPYELLGLAPFVVFPVAMAALGDVPGDLLWRRLAIAAPFALFVGMFNPLLDQQVVGTVGGVSVTGGWVSYLSIIARFLLTASAALVLIATTGMNDVCHALHRMGVPDVLVTQLLLLYRYIFVLAEQTLSMARARSLRSFGKRGMGLRVYVHMLGHLLLRTIGRAQRIYAAMQCRGFDGTVRSTRRLKMTGADVAYMLSWSAVFVLFRFVNIPLLIGQLVTGAAS